MSMKGSYQILPLKAHTILLISIFILAQSGLASNQALIVGGAGGEGGVGGDDARNEISHGGFLARRSFQREGARERVGLGLFPPE